VESKKNNSELVKSVRNLEDMNNKYIIVLDNSFDNLQVVMEQKLLKQYAETKENVVLMDIICFEYFLLEFKNIINWIYAPDDEFSRISLKKQDWRWCCDYNFQRQTRHTQEYGICGIK
jgi:hypothetical protein